MKRFILDTNILIKDPSFLKRWNSGFRYLIPDIVIEEVGKVSGRLKGAENLLHEIDNAVGKGFVHLVKINLDKHVYNDDNFRNSRVSFVDYQLANFVKDYASERDETYLVTEDRPLTKYANDIGVKTLNLFALQNQLYSFKTVNINEVDEGKTIYQFQFRHLLISFITGIVLTVLSFVIYKNIDTILSKVPIWGTSISLFLIAFLFYWVRSNYRIAYSIAEFSFGFYSAFWAISPSDPTFNFLQFTSDIAKIFSLVAGVYVMVRGLTNLGDGLKGTALESYWRRIFPN